MVDQSLRGFDVASEEVKQASIRVFGGMGVRVSGEPVSIGGARQLRLLALLAVRAGSTVSVDWLAEHLWSDEERPVAPAPAIRTYLSRLRSRLPDTVSGWIETEANGYRFTAPPAEIEHLRFYLLREKARQAREDEDPQAARRFLDQAVALWQGEPFRELDDIDWVFPEIEQLRVDRLEVLEERWEVNLAEGRHTQITGELAAFTAEHGLRDRASRQYALALHRSSRTTEALRVIDDHRRLLRSESGMDPSAGIIELENAILAGDSSLDVEKVGRPLRGYRLFDEIGSGAFAVVWRGMQPSVDREVAVKQIRSDLASRPDFIRRFEAEAHLVARIEHPHIVPLIDFWRDPDSAYLVMRWLRGGTLERRLDDGPLSVKATRTLARQMCGALAAAHRHGIVHRDVKTGNILFDEVGNAFLGDFGIALDAAVSATPAASISTGSPAYSAPEQLRRESLGPQADIFSLGVVLFECLTGTLPFHDSQSIAQLIERQLTDDYPDLVDLRSDVPLPFSRAIAKATSKQAADRFSSADEFLRALDADERDDRSPDPLPASMQNIVAPYKGLRAFDAGDSEQFFGRESVVDQLVERLSGHTVASRCVILIGPSGSGKSSVIRAGLAPALRSGVVPGADEWFSTTMVPGSDPFESLEAALLRVAVNPPDSLIDQLKGGKRGILRCLRRCLPSEEATTLVFIDQFEEVFTNSPVEVAHAFLDGLAVAVEDPATPLRLVITLRADYYDRPLAHPVFARLLDDAAVNLRPLAPDELELAIVEPARSVGVGFESGLIARITADTIGQASPLPLLQHTLAELFDRRTSNQLTIEAYEAVGGITGALAGQAESIHARASDDQRVAIRTTFGRLANPTENSADLRRRVPLADLGSGPDVSWVLDEFGTARLLTFDRDEATREPTVEVAHEALFREWPRLAAWLEDDAELLRSAIAVAEAARSWDEGGRASTDLYRGGRLEDAADFSSQTPDRLRPLDAEFINASVRSSRIDRATEQSRIRRLRRLVVGVAVALVLALAASGLAVREQQRANSEAERAQLAAETALEQAGIAEQQRETAVAATSSAELATLISRSAAAAGDDPTLSVLLALEAHRRAPGAETEQALLNALGSSASPNLVVSQRRLDTPVDGCQLASIKPRPFSTRDGTTEFGVADGLLVSRDPFTGALTEHGPAPAPCIFWMADDSLDQRWAGSMDGLTMWFGSSSDEWTEVNFGVPMVMLSDGFTDTGTLVALALNQNAFVVLLDDQSGESTGTPFRINGALGLTEISPDGQLIATGIGASGDGAVVETETVLLDGATGEEVFRFGYESGFFPAVHAFDMGARELLVGLDNGAILTVDLETEEIVGQVRTNAVTGFVHLGLRPDGLVVAVSNGQVEIVDRRAGPTGRVIAVNGVSNARVRPDDSLLLIAPTGAITILDLDGTTLVAAITDVDPLATVHVNDGRVATVRNPGGTPTILNLTTGEQETVALVDPNGQSRQATALWPMTDGFWALGVDNTLTFWDGDGIGVRFELNGEPTGWTPDFGLHAVIVQSFVGLEAKLFSSEANSGGLLFTVPAADAAAVQPNPGGGLHVVDNDGTLRTFDQAGIETSRLSIRIPEMSSNDMTILGATAVDPTTAKLAIATSDGVLLVDSGSEAVTLLPGSGSATSLRFVRNGELLAVTTRDGSVRIWDVERGVSAGRVWAGTGVSGSSSWYDSSTDTLWVNTSEFIIEIPLDPVAWVDRACAVVGRSFTRAEWEQFVPSAGAVQSAC